MPRFPLAALPGALLTSARREGGLPAESAIMLNGVLRPLLAKYISDAFDKVAGPMFDLIEVNLRESATLGAIRDALVPELGSGEIGITESKRFMERSA
jgi:hypothetical protein